LTGATIGTSLDLGKAGFTTARLPDYGKDAPGSGSLHLTVDSDLRGSLAGENQPSKGPLEAWMKQPRSIMSSGAPLKRT
jgi:hypothetical protein